MSKLQNRRINDHDYNSVTRSCICWKYVGSIYTAYMHHIFCQILHIILRILLQKVPHILRKFSAINQHPYQMARPYSRVDHSRAK